MYIATCPSYDSNIMPNGHYHIMSLWDSAFNFQYYHNIITCISTCTTILYNPAGVDEDVVNVVEGVADAVENQADADRDATLTDRLKMGGPYIYNYRQGSIYWGRQGGSLSPKGLSFPPKSFSQ